MRMDVLMDSHVGLWTSTRTSTETSTAGNFGNFVACAAMARAVKGGEAEAPDVSAPSLESLEHHP